MLVMTELKHHTESLKLSSLCFSQVELLSLGLYILLTLQSLFVTTLLKVSAEASSDVVPIFGFDGLKLVERFPKRKFSQASKHIGE